MRKKCKRIVRDESALLSEKQHDDLTFAVMLHLELVLDGQGSREHLHTIASFLNIATAVAHQKRNFLLQEKINVGTDIAWNLLVGGAPLNTLSDEDALIFRAVVTMAVKYFRLQTASTVAKAIQFVNGALDTGKGADVLGFPKGLVHEG